ncbi:MAG: SurA N-terminal domain-containing protein, partial [Candidatus Omnitrophica bacterium]|nr:SurA N-terminal domain-containing protein [Candidatus Omnitrophota bacterium]
MKRGVILTIISVFLLSTLCGCDKILGPGSKKLLPAQKKVQAAPVVKGTIIAKVNNTPITLEGLNQEIEAFNAMVPQDRPEAKITTREKKLDFLKNELVRRALLYQAAQDRGLDKKDEVLAALEKTREELAVVELVKTEAAKVE